VDCRSLRPAWLNLVGLLQVEISSNTNIAESAGAKRLRYVLMRKMQSAYGSTHTGGAAA